MTNNNAAALCLRIFNLAIYGPASYNADPKAAFNGPLAAEALGSALRISNGCDTRADRENVNAYIEALGWTPDDPRCLSMPKAVRAMAVMAAETAKDRKVLEEHAKQDRENSPGMVFLSAVDAMGWSLEALDAWATLWASGENIAALDNLHTVTRAPIDALEYLTYGNNHTPDILADILGGDTPAELSGNPEISGSTYGLRMAALYKVEEVGRDIMERVAEVDGAIEWLNDTSRTADLVRQYADHGQDAAALETLREYCRGYGKDPDVCANVDELIKLVERVGR